MPSIVKPVPVLPDEDRHRLARQVIVNLPDGRWTFQEPTWGIHNVPRVFFDTLPGKVDRVRDTGSWRKVFASKGIRFVFSTQEAPEGHQPICTDPEHDWLVQDPVDECRRCGMERTNSEAHARAIAAFASEGRPEA